MRIKAYRLVVSWHARRKYECHIISLYVLYGVQEEHMGAILSHCVYDMLSEELIFWKSTSRALQSFLGLSASVMNNDRECSLKTTIVKPGENNSINVCIKY
jgi:U3 small nucleolar RNA-associated protein 20